MNRYKKVISELEKLGLLQNQALIYVFLLQHGELRIQEIVNLTQIPRSSVYESLNVLLEMGLVEEVIDEHFKKYKPYPPSTLRHILNERMLALQKQNADLDGLEKALTLLPAELVASTTVRYYRGVTGARQLLWNTFNAKSTVFVYSAWGRGTYVGINFYKSFVRESREKKIKEKVLINPTNRVLESIRKYSLPSSPIARTNLGDIHALAEKDVLIKGETFIYNNIYAQINLHNDEITGFEIESINFTKTQRSIFDTLWNIAKPVTDFL